MRQCIYSITVQECLDNVYKHTDNPTFCHVFFSHPAFLFCQTTTFSSFHFAQNEKHSEQTPGKIWARAFWFQCFQVFIAYHQKILVVEIMPLWLQRFCCLMAKYSNGISFPDIFDLILLSDFAHGHLMIYVTCITSDTHIMNYSIMAMGSWNGQYVCLTWHFIYVIFAY